MFQISSGHVEKKHNQKEKQQIKLLSPLFQQNHLKKEEFELVRCWCISFRIHSQLMISCLAIEMLFSEPNERLWLALYSKKMQSIQCTLR